MSHRLVRSGRSVAAVILSLGCCAATGTTTAIDHAAMRHGTASTSTNWSGYDVTAGGYTSTSASWIQPAVNCASTGKKSAYASFWVGLDGDGSSSVEQTGTDSDCSHGRPVYYGWYEMYPAYPVNYTNPVAPGDSMTASVTTDGHGNFTLMLRNNTRGWTQTQHQSLASAALQSAEIIAEAPSSSHSVLPLANFGSVTFTASQANGVGIGTLNPTAITMATSNYVKAQPGPLTNNDTFTVTWQHS